jgi:hypothetical protein
LIRRRAPLAGAAVVLACAPASASSLRVCVSVEEPPAGVTAPSVAEQMAAGLRQASVAACADAGSTEVRIRGNGERVEVVVRDGVTGKSVTRSYDLRALPPAGRAMAVAIYAEELVVASWAETLVAPKPIPGAERAHDVASQRAGGRSRVDVVAGVGARGAFFTGGLFDAGPAV